MIFDGRYEVFLADTLESKTLHYQLRYQVYCEETGWERKRQFLQKKLERDGVDDFSHHFLVWDHVCETWVGGVRLVELPFSSLPISKYCSNDNPPPEFLGVGRCVEVSRLFVLPDFRCGRRQSPKVAGELAVGGERDKRGYHFEIMLGLIRAAREFGLNSGINSWYFLVEPSLARGIKRVGIDLHRCGPDVQHRGLRRPYSGEVDTCFDGVFSGQNEISAMFSKQDTYRPYSRLGFEGVGSFAAGLPAKQVEVCSL